jgi:hypothetical protein
LGPKLFLLRFKVKINWVLCLLDSRAMHLFVTLSAVVGFEWVATKVAKPIKVQLTQKVAISTSEVVLGDVLECGKTKFTENFTICTLDGIKAILRNTFLNATIRCLERKLEVKNHY